MSFQHMIMLVLGFFPAEQVPEVASFQPFAEQGYIHTSFSPDGDGEMFYWKQSDGTKMTPMARIIESPLEEAESDEAILVKMHRDVLRYHLENDLASWLANESDDYISANGGEISYPTLEERRAQRGPYLEQTTFTEYRDLVDPVVRVSQDGTLGWVICQVRMAGEQQSDDGEAVPIGSVWAWIELYEKRDGRWLLVGNVSNRKRD